MNGEGMANTILDVQNLRVNIKNQTENIPVVENVSFSLRQGEIIGLVGESGCGKSISSMSIVDLNSKNAFYGEQSRIFYNPEDAEEAVDLMKLGPKDMRTYRGKEISVIFQDSLTGLDPVLTLGNIMTEAIRAHKKISKREALEEAVEMLRSVGIPAPEVRIHEYAHQLSGGMRQRVMIALAMLHHSKILIADEPTTALDVTIQDHILQLIRKLRDKEHMSVILITHDMGVVAEMTDYIYVMYSGRIVEEGPTKDIFEHPKHPYTIGLLKSIPRLDKTEDVLYTIPGTVPRPGSIQQGCRFAGRCPYASKKCRDEEPELFINGNSRSRCWNCAELNNSH